MGFPEDWAVYDEHATSTNPSSTVRSMPHYINAANLSSTWWTNYNNGGAGAVRVALSDGTLLPCKCVNMVDNGTTGTGTIFFGWTGDKTSSESRKVRVYCGNSGASEAAATATYGQYNVFPLGCHAFFHDGHTDLTRNALTLTNNGSYSAGAAAGPIGNAATEYNGTSQYGSMTTAINAPALTLIAYGNADVITANMNAVGIGDTSSGTQYIYLQWRGAVASDLIGIVHAAGGSAATGVSATGFAASTWCQSVARVNSNTSRYAGINGVLGAQDTTSRATTSIDTLAVGASLLSTPGGYFDGKLSLVQVYDVALSDAWIAHEAAMLNQATFWGSWTSNAVTATAPTIQTNGAGASASINVYEGNTRAVTTVRASGVGAITYSLSGADAARFTIGSTSGILTPVAALDYDTPTDANTDGVYEVTVTATNATGSDTQDLSITILDADGIAHDILSRNSLVSYYRMGEAASPLVDLLSGYNATVSGATLEASSLVTGDANKAVTFDGVDDSATLASNDYFDFDLDTPFSVEFIVSPNLTRGGGETRPVVSKFKTTNVGRGWEVGLQWGAWSYARPYVYLSDTDLTKMLKRSAVIDMPNGVAAHVLCTYDGSGTTAGIRIYVNASERTYADESTGTPVTIRNSAALSIGARPSTQWMKGTLDEVAIYSEEITPYNAAECFARMKGTAVDETPLPTVTSAIASFDADSDVGDMGGGSVMHALADLGELNILATVVGSSDAAVAELIDCLNTYHLRPDIPIGKMATDPVTTHAWVATTVAACEHDLVGASAPNSVSVIRQHLAAAADSSVVLIEIGYLNVMSGLMDSAADGYSALNGVDLVAAKCPYIVCMGGIYTIPDANGNAAEYNFRIDPAATDNFIDKCTVPIYFIGYESADGYVVGQRLSADAPSNDPTRVAYNADGLLATGRPAWDHLPFLFAARGKTHDGTPLFAAIPGGNVVNSSTGVNTWTYGAGNHFLVRPGRTNSAMKTLIEALEVATPGAATSGLLLANAAAQPSALAAAFASSSSPPIL